MGIPLPHTGTENMSASLEGVSLPRQVRKLRKKLRQIENLERLERNLQEEERLKVTKKFVFRDRLHDILSQITEDDAGNSSSIYSQGDSSLASDDWSTFTETEAEESMMDVKSEPTDYEHGEMDTTPTEDVKKSPEKEKSPVKPSAPVIEQTSCQPSVKAKTRTEGRDPVHVMRKKWKNSFCFITEYTDHSDIVNDLAVDGKLLVTASRDTTLKVWNLEEGRQLRNLGGHTGSVTTVFLLSEKASQNSSLLSGKPLHHRLVISGSVDCSFKIWNTATGAILKSVYTYNPITRIICTPQGIVVTGSDGGKLELWDMESGENLYSTIAFDGAVTALRISDNYIYSSSSAGVVKIYQIRDNCLACMFESENLKSVSGSPVTPRFIRSLAVSKNTVYFGDDAINIKALEWKSGTVKKLPNHTDEFASTDAICCFEDLILSSSYDLDNGLGYINIRSLQKGDYLATLDDEDTERIISVGCTRLKSGNLLMITGGLQLKFWEIDETHSPSQEEENETAIRFIPRLTRPGRDSDLESDDDLSESDIDLEPDLDDSEDAVPNLSFKNEEEKTSWFSYCAIL